MTRRLAAWLVATACIGCGDGSAEAPIALGDPSGSRVVVSGRVTSYGLAVAGARISLLEEDDVAPTDTDAAGRFALSRVPAHARTTLAVDAADHVPLLLPIETAGADVALPEDALAVSSPATPAGYSVGGYLCVEVDRPKWSAASYARGVWFRADPPLPFGALYLSSDLQLEHFPAQGPIGCFAVPYDDVESIVVESSGRPCAPRFGWPVGEGRIQARAATDKLTIIQVECEPDAPSPELPLVSPFSSWSYLVDAEPAADWKTDASDATWSVASTPLIAQPASDRITTYYRRVFHVLPGQAIDHLVLHVVGWDGAIVWLNGVEVLHSVNVPADATATTLAARPQPDTGWMSTIVPPELATGDTPNVIAVEAHRAVGSSPTTYFDLSLSAVLAP